MIPSRTDCEAESDLKARWRMRIASPNQPVLSAGIVGRAKAQTGAVLGYSTFMVEIIKK
jgi:hypothetical protein